MKIFIVGMPGAGKSVLGKELSNLLKIPFYDLDEGIEKEMDMAIPEIFESKGEKFFRTLESKLLRRFPELTGHFVLSTGGGAPCFFDNMGFMNEEGKTIFLNVPVEELARRLMDVGLEDRPLLKDFSESELKQYLEGKFRERSVFYDKAALVLKGSDISAQDIFIEIEKKGWVKKKPDY